MHVRGGGCSGYELPKNPHIFCCPAVLPATGKPLNWRPAVYPPHLAVLLRRLRPLAPPDSGHRPTLTPDHPPHWGSDTEQLYTGGWRSPEPSAGGCPASSAEMADGKGVSLTGRALDEDIYGGAGATYTREVAEVEEEDEEMDERERAVARCAGPAASLSLPGPDGRQERPVGSAVRLLDRGRGGSGDTAACRPPLPPPCCLTTAALSCCACLQQAGVLHGSQGGDERPASAGGW